MIQKQRKIISTASGMVTAGSTTTSGKFRTNKNLNEVHQSLTKRDPKLISFLDDKNLSSFHNTTTNKGDLSV